MQQALSTKAAPERRRAWLRATPVIGSRQRFCHESSRSYFARAAPLGNDLAFVLI
jgi:hypothetical protein